MQALIAALSAVAFAGTPAPGQPSPPRAADTRTVAKAGFAVPLQLEEPLGRRRENWPLRTGVPFARGSLRDVRQLGLRRIGDHGRQSATPLQARVLSRWADGSVKWALLDWQADLDPRESARWVVHPAASAAAARKVLVEKRGDAIAIDTGPLSFQIPVGHFAVAERVRVRGSELQVGAVAAELRVDGETYRADAPQKVLVTEEGPLRVRVELRGSYGAGIRYVVRVDAFAGQTFLRVLHSFENHGSAPYANLERLSLEVPIRVGETARYRAGREEAPPVEGRPGAEPAVLLQRDNQLLSVDGTEEAARAAGWVRLGDGTSGVALAARFFWQEYPQSFEVKRQSLAYHLWAPQEGPAKIGSGAAKTHEVFLHFHGTNTPEDGFLDALAQPLLAHVDPMWTTRSGALRNSVAPVGAAAPFLEEFGSAFSRQRRHADRERWDDGGAVHCTPRERPRQGFYGMLNWGDWNFPGYRDGTKGCDAWGNLEYDLTQVLALAYAATGNRAYHEAMVASARHFMDVDRIHFNAGRPAWVGMNHPKNPLHFTFELGGVDLGHTWTEGLSSYYALTGDERALDALRGIADYLVRRLRAGVRGNPRQWGWPQIALLAAYETTGDEAYAHAARRYARGGMAAHAPDSSPHWKLAILAEALTYTHESTNDPDIAAWLRRFAEAALRRGQSLDQRFAPALAYVGRMLGNAEMKAAARPAIEHPAFGSWAKPLTIAGRVGFRVLSQTAADSPPAGEGSAAPERDEAKGAAASAPDPG